MDALNKDLNSDAKSTLIRSAKVLFAQKGFDGVSVKEIADHAGVNISLISYHFGGKEGLYRTCLEQFGTERLASAERLLSEVASVEEFKTRLTIFVEDFIEQHAKEPEVTSIIHRECTSGHPVIDEIFTKFFMKQFKCLIDFFESARAKKILDPKVDVLVTVGTFFGSIIHILRTAPLAEKHFGVSMSDPAFKKNFVTHIIQNLLHGIQGGR
ncbi:MAG: helix-turn-helix transcriptional regulator [Bdellovibrionales bacterium]|nr:helix-turn-helix transcriptional regulator [Bdellovibrionales bacterium]